jgi:hypothetical protein
MIQANELRIGNYVKALGEYRIVMGITSGEFPSSYVKFEGLIPVKIIHLNPIEITEEVLEKLGFDKDYQGIFTKSIEGDYFEIRFCNLQKIICIDVWVNYEELILDLKHIKYVHQLQNLYFALTTKELKL